MSHLVSSSGELELKIVTAIHADLNAAEQEARKTIEAFCNRSSYCNREQSPGGTKIPEVPGMMASRGCNSALQEATVSERGLLTCAAFEGSIRTSRIWQRTNSRLDSRYASSPVR